MRSHQRSGPENRRYLVVADELRDEYDRLKALQKPPRAGWKDAIRYLEELSMKRSAPASTEEAA